MAVSSSESSYREGYSNSENKANDPSFFYQMYRGEYQVDQEEQGYAGFSKEGMKGRLVSLIEIPLGPIRYVLDTLASAVISVALLAVTVVAIAARFLTLTVSYFTSFAPDSTVHKIVLTGDAFAKWAIESSTRRVYVFGESVLKNLAKVPTKLLGNIAGVIIPKIGQEFRTYKNQRFYTMDIMVESFIHIDVDLVGNLAPRLESIWEEHHPREAYSL